MPGLYKDEGIVLKTMPLGDADRIITLYTRAHGKVRAVAKGIRRTKSRFGARLEPFTRADLVIYRGRNLDTITSADIVTSFDEVRSDYPSLAAAAALAELVDKITPERERAVGTYMLLLGGLQSLATGWVATVVPAFLIKLLSISGYHPQLGLCTGCDAPQTEGFSPELGGVVCSSCARDDRSTLPITSDRIALMARLLTDDFGRLDGADDEAVAEVTRALGHYAEHHLERRLKSLQLLAAS